MRELKQRAEFLGGMKQPSHPAWVRELKPHILVPIILILRSHPAWVRELKLSMEGIHPGLARSRTPRGCVN